MKILVSSIIFNSNEGNLADKIKSINESGTTLFHFITIEF